MRPNPLYFALLTAIALFIASQSHAIPRVHGRSCFDLRQARELNRKRSHFAQSFLYLHKGKRAKYLAKYFTLENRLNKALKGC